VLTVVSIAFSLVNDDETVYLPSDGLMDSLLRRTQMGSTGIAGVVLVLAMAGILVIMGIGIAQKGRNARLVAVHKGLFPLKTSTIYDLAEVMVFLSLLVLVALVSAVILVAQILP